MTKVIQKGDIGYIHRVFHKLAKKHKFPIQGIILIDTNKQGGLKEFKKRLNFEMAALKKDLIEYYVTHYLTKPSTKDQKKEK